MPLRRRPPQRLQALAFKSWLKALDTDLCYPEQCPTTYLLQALSTGSKVNESTIIRVIQAISLSGVQELDIGFEIFDPIMLNELSRALLQHPSQLTKLSLNLSKRLPSFCFRPLIESLKKTDQLEELTITGANDDLLCALLFSNPPLKKLNVSNSKYVTDYGMQEILTVPCKNGYSVASKLTETLTNLSILETSVTPRGCAWMLWRCQQLATIWCEWTMKGLIFIESKQYPPTNLKKLIINESKLSADELLTIKNMCPKLTNLTIKLVESQLSVAINEFLTCFPMLEELTVSKFSPFKAINREYITIYPHKHLRRLSLWSYYNSKVDLSALQVSIPMLEYLTLEGCLIPTITNDLNLVKPFSQLLELRLNTSYSDEELDPSLTIKIVSKMTKKLTLLELGSCDNFEDLDFCSLLLDESLDQIKYLSLSGAGALSFETLQSLLERSLELRTLVLKLIPTEKLAELEDWKKELKLTNVDLELVTYGYSWWALLGCS